MSGFGEIVGIVSAVAALIELSGKILEQGYSYTVTAAKAPTQLRQLLSEVSSLDVLLNKIADLVDESPVSPNPTLTKIATHDRWNECETLLNDVMKVVSKCEPREGRALGNAVRRAQWPLEKKETTNLMQNLQRLRSYFDSAIAIDTAVQVNRAVEGIQALRDTEEFKRHLSWVCPADTDINTNLYSLQQARYPGTCHWLLNSTSYLNWKNEHPRRILWVNGPPGSGKTIMSTAILQNLRESFPDSDQAIVHFSLDHRDSKTQSLSAILSRTIKQLLNSKPDGIEYVKSMKEASNAGTEMKINTKLQADLLKVISRTFKNVFLVIDGLDECASTAEIQATIECLSYLTRESNSLTARAAVSACCTSRRLLHIEKSLTQSGCEDISIDSGTCPEVRQDIRIYITGQVETIVTAGSLARHGSQSSISLLQDRAVETVAAKADGLFLQAKCHLDFLADAPSVKRFRTALENLPNGLVQTYDLILSQIRRKYSRYMTEILRMLRWISGVREPTTVAALAQVAIIEPNDTSLDIEAMWLNDDELLLMLSGLITVEDGHRGPVVRFSHYTVKEYLQSRDIQAGPQAEFFIDPETIDREIARICLQYLSFDQFAEPGSSSMSTSEARSLTKVFSTRGYTSALPDAFMNPLALYVRASVRDRVRRSWEAEQSSRHAKDLAKKLEEYPVLAYASMYWVDHVNDSGLSASELSGLTPGLKDWLCDVEGHDPRFLNWTHIQCSMRVNADPQQLEQPPLYFALLFGVLPWVQSLADQTCLTPPSWITPFKGGWNAITLATASRSIPTVDVVLSRAELDVVDTLALTEATKNRTALHIASELGDAKMIEHLLRKGASPWALSRSGTTPLYRVAGTGSVEGLTMLFESVDEDRRTEYINMRTWDDWTALMYAVLQGRFDAVYFLLQHGADWSVTNLQGQNALSMATRLKYRKIWSVLTRRMIAENKNSTALDVKSDAGDSWAAACLGFTVHHDVDKEDVMPLKQQLVDATSLTDRSKIIQDALRVKLEKIFGIPVESFERSTSMLVLGIDSLMAAELRSWFLGEMEVDVMVLDILTNTVGTICARAAADFSKQ